MTISHAVAVAAAAGGARPTSRRWVRAQSPARMCACIYLISLDIYVDFRSAFALRFPLHVRCALASSPTTKKKKLSTRALRSKLLYIFFFVSPMLSAHCVASVYCIRLATNEKKYVTATIPSNNFHSIHTTIRNKWHIKDAHLARSCGFAEWNISNLSLESMEHGCLPSNYISHQQLETK